MSKKATPGSPPDAPVNEQQICLTCGFCCDGTLFLRATLKKEDAGHLPEKIEEARVFEDRKELFRLPCDYFSGKCTIYETPRPKICGSFRCQLLKDLKDEKLTSQDAVEIVRKARETRSELLNKYQVTTTGTEITNFRQLLLKLGKILNSPADQDTSSRELEVLLSKCNIFETLLIRHFRSADDFKKIME
jgi:hypothetical protein